MQTTLPMPPAKVSLKLIIHKGSNRVLYAEAGKEFLEFIFNILCLPVGALTTLLKPDIMFGHLGNVNDSIRNLSPSFGSRMRSSPMHYPANGLKEGLYLVKNDLEVKPLSTASLVPLLNEFHVKEGDLEEKVVDLGMDEGLKLLKATLQSKDVLTDVFLPTVKPEV
ncbi:hypothetical protein SO802_017370 [Lithocarpus litseifolius]|uniref:Uncharacterized protein n=1 Tax=Lithocarpus litseifolius TaxID=425828 RepID=A0AAW2CHZ7_9ROSI